MEKDVQYPQEKEQWLPTMVTVITMGMADYAGTYDRCYTRSWSTMTELRQSKIFTDW